MELDVETFQLREKNPCSPSLLSLISFQILLCLFLFCPLCLLLLFSFRLRRLHLRPFIYLIYSSPFLHISPFSCPSSVPFLNLCHVRTVLFLLYLNRNAILQRLTFTLFCRAYGMYRNHFSYMFLILLPPQKNQMSSCDHVPHQIQASHCCFTYKISLERRTCRWGTLDLCIWEKHTKLYSEYFMTGPGVHTRSGLDSPASGQGAIAIVNTLILADLQKQMLSLLLHNYQLVTVSARPV